MSLTTALLEMQPRPTKLWSRLPSKAGSRTFRSLLGHAMHGQDLPRDRLALTNVSHPSGDHSRRKADAGRDLCGTVGQEASVKMCVSEQR